MDIFDLLFLGVALTTTITLVGAGASALVGRSGSARRMLRRVAIGLGAYALIVAATSAMVPRRAVHIGQRMCFDDWCIRVDSVSRAPTRCAVTFSILSEAKRVTQRERGLAVYLEDAAGRRVAPESDPKDVPFDEAVGPGDSFQATRTFKTSPNQQIAGIVVRHTGFPIDWFIIGVGPFRPPPIVRFTR